MLRSSVRCMRTSSSSRLSAAHARASGQYAYVDFNNAAAAYGVCVYRAVHRERQGLNWLRSPLPCWRMQPAAYSRRRTAAQAGQAPMAVRAPDTRCAMGFERAAGNLHVSLRAACLFCDTGGHWQTAEHPAQRDAATRRRTGTCTAALLPCHLLRRARPCLSCCSPLACSKYAAFDHWWRTRTDSWISPCACWASH